MDNRESILSELYPDLDNLRERARARQKKYPPRVEPALEALRGTMDDIFGDIQEEMVEIQSSNTPTKNNKNRNFNFRERSTLPVLPRVSHGVSHTVSHPEVVGTEGSSIPVSQPVSQPVSHVLWDGLTRNEEDCETVSHCETPCETVSQESLFPPCETPPTHTPKIHPNKIRFLSYVLTYRTAGKPWRFSVKEVADKMGMKYITVRNYPVSCQKKGWMKYQTIRMHNWQGIEVEWVDRNIEELLLKRVQKNLGKTCETGLTCFTHSPCETPCETVSQCETPSAPLDRKNKDNLSILKYTSIERERLLALPDHDVEFFYPNLAKIGFGSVQIRQIVERLEQLDKPLDKVRQGMEHANFELGQGQIEAAGGKPVDQPLGYVFRALATTGYYRRPEGYISVAEQAERDAAKELAKVFEARKMREDADFETWVAGLTNDQRTKLLAGRIGPEKQWLKKKWREQTDEYQVGGVEVDEESLDGDSKATPS